MRRFNVLLVMVQMLNALCITIVMFIRFPGGLILKWLYENPCEKRNFSSKWLSSPFNPCDSQLQWYWILHRRSYHNLRFLIFSDNTVKIWRLSNRVDCVFNENSWQSTAYELSILKLSLTSLPLLKSTLQTILFASIFFLFVLKIFYFIVSKIIIGIFRK